MRGLILRVAIVVTSVATIAVNLLANAVPFFGRTTGEISAMFPTLITPAGYVFAIWGVIYIGLVALSVGVFLEPLRRDPMPERIAVPIVVSNVANVTWLLLWHSLQIVWTVPVQIVLLGSLIAAYVLARRDRPDRPSAIERWCVWAPLGLYLGWVSVATIADFSAALVAIEWSGFGLAPEFWAVVVLVVGFALALAVLFRESDAVYAGVFVWAFLGILVASASALVGYVALALAVAIAGVVVWSLAVRRRVV